MPCLFATPGRLAVVATAAQIAMLALLGLSASGLGGALLLAVRERRRGGRHRR